MIYTDRANYQTRTKDPTSGETTKGTPLEVKARIESEDLVKKGADGSTTVYKRLYILPPTVDIKEGDFIKAVKIGGKVITEDYMKVEVVFPVARYRLHHYEVYCK